MRSRSVRNAVTILALIAVATLTVAGGLGWRRIVERYYLHRLENGSAEERREAARELAAMESKTGLKQLLVLPSPDVGPVPDMDFYTRVLVESDAAAVPLVLEALRNGETRARYRAAVVLQRLRPHGATRVLVDALAHEDGQDVVLGSLAFQEPQPGEAIEALSAALRSESSTFRKGAAAALGRVKLTEDELSAARRLLERGLGDPVAEVRIYSAWSLGDIVPRRQSMDSLVDCLDDEVRNVRRAAARALAAMGAEARPARAALERALRDPGNDVRKYASEALAAIRARER